MRCCNAWVSSSVAAFCALTLEVDERCGLMKKNQPMSRMMNPAMAPPVSQRRSVWERSMSLASGDHEAAAEHALGEDRRDGELDALGARGTRRHLLDRHCRQA